MQNKFFRREKHFSCLALFLFLFASLFFPTLEAGAAPKIYQGFWRNVGESFTENVPYHLTAVAATPALIYSGADAKVHTAFSGNKSDIFTPVDIAGYIAPYAVTAPMYVYGVSSGNHRTQGAAFALIHSTVITLSTISILKAFTGRPPPDESSPVSTQRQSRTFNFGVLRRGIYDGWPSGHMATISAMAGTLMAYYPQRSWVQWTGAGIMSYVFVGVSAHHRGQFHWFSDAVAGGLVGYSIGRTVGTNMREEVTGIKAEEKASFNMLPLIGPGISGAQLVWVH